MVYRPVVSRPPAPAAAFRAPAAAVNYRFNVNNNVYYGPRNFSTCVRPGWSGPFWGGMGFGLAARESYLAAEYGRFAGYYPGTYYYPPFNYWNPYYRSVLAAPLFPPPFYSPPAMRAPVQLSPPDEQLLASLI